MLPDGSLGELERVRIVGCDRIFNDGRRLLWRPIVALGRPLVAVCRGRCRDVLPDVGERRLVQGGGEVRQHQAQRGRCRDRVQQYEGLTGRVRQIRPRTGLGERAEGVLDRLRLGRRVYGFRELAPCACITRR
jgi:hypothetical protein